MSEICLCLGNTVQTINKDEKDHADTFISIQAFPALVDVPDVSEISRISCGSRHTAAVTGDVTGSVNWTRLEDGHEIS